MNNTKKSSEYIYPCDQWNIIEEEFQIENNLRNETIFSLGNGYIGMRGTFEEGLKGLTGAGIDGTYINGFYESKTIKYPEIAYGYANKGQTMLNVANGKIIRLYVDDDEFDMLSGNISEYKRTLSIKEGVLYRSLVWETTKGKKIKIEIQRIVSFKNKYLVAINYEITPLNFNGKIKLLSAIDGDVSNQMVEDDPRSGSELQGKVLYVEDIESDSTGCFIAQKTSNSNLSIACAIKNQITGSFDYVESNVCYDFFVGSMYEADVKKGNKITINKYIAYATSKEFQQDLLSFSAKEIVKDAYNMGFSTIKAMQVEYLQDFWLNSDIEIKGDIAIQQGLRFNMFQLLQSVGRDGKTNIGAKGLTGEGYQGHCFWDTEMYILPVFLYSKPEISRELLKYRYNILSKARKRARELSHLRGALFPWRTIDGEECSAYYPAGTAQYHINADIAFAIKRYMEATLDKEFLLNYGAEILFETARIWVDLGFLNPRNGNKFCINGVTGPDEYNAIVDNNCYTNFMARENMSYAHYVAIWMKENAPLQYDELKQKINLSDKEPEQWKKAADSMFIPYDKALGIYLQDDGFLDRVPWDFENTPKDKYPLLLHYHPLVIYRHQICKQADLVLALLMMGDMCTIERKRRNYDFYEKVTTHDSSLSTAIFSIVASEIGYHNKAYDYFLKTARMDLDDLHGNTKDGIHAANMAGTWLCLVNGFAGMRVNGGKLGFSPYLPYGWDEYSLKMIYQGRRIKVSVNKAGTRYQLLEGDEITIIHKGKEILLSKIVIAAIIFDLDGVIVSTDEYHYQAWQKIANQEKIYFDREINNRLRGVSRIESLEILLEQSEKKYTFEQKQELVKKKNDYYKTLIQGLTHKSILSGVKDLLASIKKAGIKAAVASSSKNAARILDFIGLRDYFDVITSGDDILKSKPDPEVYVLTAQRLCVDPGKCIVIEDARVGIDAAVKAGMIPIGIGDAALYEMSTIKRKSLENLTITEISKSINYVEMP